MKYLNLSEIFGRIASVAIYTFPFLELYGFFNPFLRSIGMSVAVLEDAAIYVRENAWLNFSLFTAIIIITQSRRMKLNYFIRYNMLQALVILFISSFMDTCGYLFPVLILGRGSIGYPIFNLACFCSLILITYCIVFAFLGRIPNIPLMTLSIKLQMWDDEKE